MKRDMELIRTLLFRLEDLGRPMTTIMFSFGDEELQVEGKEADEILGHLEMLLDGGLIIGKFGAGGDLIFQKLSWSGHEFLAAVRDREVWEQTKQAAKKGGVESLEFLWEVAKAVGKKQFQQRTGLDL